jgi:hypothetical protein
MTSVEGLMKAYWYHEGYIRTASKDFTLKNFNKYVHLTNDAIQKTSDEYGRYEEGNKISFQTLQTYLQQSG